jgi:hypothetical protein
MIEFAELDALNSIPGSRDFRPEMLAWLKATRAFTSPKALGITLRQVDQTAEFPEHRLFLVTPSGKRRRQITSGAEKLEWA